LAQIMEYASQTPADVTAALGNLHDACQRWPLVPSGSVDKPMPPHAPNAAMIMCSFSDDPVRGQLVTFGTGMFFGGIAMLVAWYITRDFLWPLARVLWIITKHSTNGAVRWVAQHSSSR
jgi:hypothetical protein